MNPHPIIGIIKAILNHEAVPFVIGHENWTDIIDVARRHSLLYLPYFAIRSLPEESKPNAENYRLLKKAFLQEVYCNEKQLYASAELQTRFEKNGIYNLELKGANTKQRYADPVLRHMRDLDILYRPEQEDALRQTMHDLGYGDFSEGRKHDHYHRKPISVEMHRELVAADSPFSSYYADIWTRCSLKENCSYTYEMRPEDEYIYNIIHLTEHFKAGGIGIRFVMDVYVYEYFVELDHSYVEEELRKLGIGQFFENIRLLSEWWFGTKPDLSTSRENLLKKLSDYVIACGLYGNADNSAALSVANHGRVGFLIKACFPSYREMCSMFPWLSKWPFLLPYSWILRGIRSLKYRRGNITGRLKMAQSGDVSKGHALLQFYKDCGL